MAEQQRRVSRVEVQRARNDAPPVVDVVLLTNDAKLLATVREASSPHHALWQADSPNAAIELLVGGRCGILIADLALMQGDTLNLLVRLQSQFPELIILATGRRDEEVAVASAISSGCIYRFLHKPVSPARASLFLGTATRRYGELRQINELALATLRQKARHTGSHKLRWGVAAAAVVGALCLWLAMDRRSERVANSAEQSPDDFLARAQSAFRSGRLSGDGDDNALSLYRQALDASPDSSEARSGIDRVMAALDKRVVTALHRGDAVAASNAFADLQRAHPAHPHLAGLNRQLEALSAQLATNKAQSTVAPQPAAASRIDVPTPSTATALPPATPPPLSTTPAVATSVTPAVASTVVATTARPTPPVPTPQIDRARARLAASQLLAPVDDSAADYLRRAREAGEDETRLKITATDLGARLLDQAHHALQAGKLADAQKDYDAAAALDGEFELGLPDLQSIGLLLTQSKQAAASEPIRIGPNDPISDSTTTAAPTDETTDLTQAAPSETNATASPSP